MANGTSTVTSIFFETVQPFYVIDMLQSHQIEFPAISNLDFYRAFPEAQKMQERILLYIAEELKQGPLDIDLEYGGGAVIKHPDRAIGDREENILDSYINLISALPKQNPYLPEARLKFLGSCKQ